MAPGPHIEGESPTAVVGPAPAPAQILDAVQEGIVVCDADGVIAYCNPYAGTLMGRPAANLVGASLMALEPVGEDGEPTAADAAPWAVAARGERVDEATLGIPVPDGPTRWLAVSATRVSAQGGGAVVLGLGDIAIRRRREELVARLGRILEQSRDEVYVFDAQSLMLMQVNRSALAGTGYAMEDLRVMTPVDLMPAMTAAAFRRILSPLLDGDVQRVQFETEHRRRDGSTYPVEVRLQMVESESPPVVASLVLDISARYEAERALRGREEENRRLANEQGALRRVATAVAREGDPQAVFDLACLEARRLMGARSVGLVRFDDVDAVRVGGAGEEADAVFPTSQALELDGVASRVRDTAAPVRLDDEGVVAVPVRAGDRLWGAMGIAGTAGLPSDSRTVERLRRFAELVGIAVSNAEARARLAALAATDHLTGLANHRTFQERLAQEVNRASRHGRRLSLVLLDIDHFKQVNDDLGHQVGDAVIRETARRLASLARSSDLIARVGGDEFAWLIPEGGGMEAWRAADRAREAIAAEPFEGIGQLTVSAGVCDLDQAHNPNDLFRLADGALYWAKQHGRDVAFLYSPEVVEVLSDAEQAERLSRLQALQSIRVLARAVDAKDPSTRQHSERVAEIAHVLALELGWSAEDAGALRDTGLVHDVGKIAIPDAILFKPGRLTDEEYTRVKTHAALGAQIVADVLSTSQVAWVRGHHERWDGRGYPDGLAGNAIPEGARILTLADSWDVMTSARPYSDGLGIDAAVEECRRCSGAQFWPPVVEALERVIAAGALPVER